MQNFKDHTNILSFLERNGIDDIQDFYSKIGEMNKSFYVLKDEVEKAEKDILNIDKKIVLWEEYNKLKPTLKKYDALNISEKKVVHDKHFVKIDRAAELYEMWKKYKENVGAISPKQWQVDQTKYKNDISLCKWKIEQFKDELNHAEKIKKSLDEIQNVANKRKINNRGEER